MVERNACIQKLAVDHEHERNSLKTANEYVRWDEKPQKNMDAHVS